MEQLLRGQVLIVHKKGEKERSSRIRYRDPIHIRNDVISALVQHGELNQSKLVSYCNLNNTKHGQIIHDLVQKGMITKTVEKWGNKIIIKYRVSELGKRFMHEIMQPYEELFPRTERINFNIVSKATSRS